MDQIVLRKDWQERASIQGEKQMSDYMLPVVILAGGLGTRLGPLTKKQPKSMIDINGEPFIAHQLRMLKEQGIKEVAICTGYLGEQIEDYVGDGSRFGLMVGYSTDWPKRLGTAGAIKNLLNKEWRQLLTIQALFVLYGDSYLTCNFEKVQKVFLEGNEVGWMAGLMTIMHNDNKWDASNVEYADGEIKAYDKGNSNLRYIDYGLSIFQRKVFSELPSNKERDLADVYKSLLLYGRLAAHEVKERFYEIGSPKGLAEFRRYLKGKK